MNNKKLVLGMLCSGFLCMGAVMAGQQQKEYQPVYATTPVFVIASSQDMMDLIDNCNNGDDYDGQVVRLDADITITLTKKPANGSVFAGEFDGNNHTITLNINTSNTATGIWRNINGNVHDLNLEGTITNSGTYASPLCLYNNGTIRNVSSSITANLPTVDYVSGILFRNNSGGKIYDCEFSGNITGKNYVAGIVSDNQRYMTSCVNNGTVSGTSYVGGIAATTDKPETLNNTSYLHITNCVNNGSVSSTSGGYAAGIVGYYSRGRVDNCINNGIISSSGQYVGGITAVMGTTSSAKVPYDDLSLLNCKNYGDVSTTNKSIGGISGFAYPNTKIKYCDNYGSVSASSSSGVGGIVGYINQSCTAEGAETLIEACYNGGHITGKTYSGGILGYVGNGVTPIVQINNCFSTGDVESPAASGEINCGTLVGKGNTGELGVNANSFAVGELIANASTSNKGYGVGSGTAASSASSLANGVSNNFKAVIKFIREYTCSEDKTAFRTAFESLSSAELGYLAQVTYYDELTQYEQTYLSAANYINGYTNSQSFMVLFNSNNQSGLVIIILAIASISIIAGIIIIRKKKAS